MYGMPYWITAPVLPFPPLQQLELCRTPSVAETLVCAAVFSTPASGGLPLEQAAVDSRVRVTGRHRGDLGELLRDVLGRAVARADGAFQGERPGGGVDLDDLELAGLGAEGGGAFGPGGVGDAGGDRDRCALGPGGERVGGLLTGAGGGEVRARAAPRAATTATQGRRFLVTGSLPWW